MDVSVIVVNYNAGELAAACIDSVFAHTSGLDFEMILVDNASTDGSRSRFEADARIRYVYSPENLGFGRANNLGLTYASGRNILFLNSDTLLRDNAIKILSDYLDAHPGVGAVGGNLVDGQGLPGQSFMRYYPSLWEEFNLFWDGLPDRLRYGRNRFYNHGGKPLAAAVISGADLMVPRKVLDACGAFDPDFFLYYEDTELCFRIHRAGFRLMALPDARIVHLGGGSTGGDRAKIASYARKMAARRCFLSKTCTPFKARLIMGMRRLTVETRLLVHRFHPERRAKWKAYQSALG